MSKMAFIKPFKYQNFIYLFASEIFFYISAWMSIMTFGVMATDTKGNSPFYISLIGFSFNIPMLLGPIIGVMVDRYQYTNILKGSITYFHLSGRKYDTNHS